MNKKIAALLCAAAVAAPTHAAVVFQDSFNSNSTSAWTFSGLNSGNWAGADNKLQSATTQTNHDGADVGFASINGLSTTSHFKLEADVQVIGTVPGRGSDFGHVGFFWGYNSNSAYSTTYLRTHADHVTVWKSPFTTESTMPLSFNAMNATDPFGVSYHLAIEVDYLTRTMILSLDNVTATYTDTVFDAANSAGGIGGQLGMITWGERVSYDNVVLTDYTATVPEPATLLLTALGAGALLLRHRT